MKILKMFLPFLILAAGLLPNRTDAAERAFSAAEDDPALFQAHPEVSMVLETAHFNESIRRTHQLLHPPKNLHPWLKWLLYSGRADKKMVREYYTALKKRDQIYRRALHSYGRFGIVYRNKLFTDILPYVAPEWGEGDYVLVLLREPPAFSATDAVVQGDSKKIRAENS